MNQRLFSRFELVFLDFTIRSLSRSRLTRSLLTCGYQLMHHSRLIWFGILLSLSGIVGLLSGCLLYLLFNWRG